MAEKVCVPFWGSSTRSPTRASFPLRERAVYPVRECEMLAVAVAFPDDVRTDRHAGRSFEHGHGDRRNVYGRPDEGEFRIAGRVEVGGRLSGRAGGQHDVERRDDRPDRLAAALREVARLEVALEAAFEAVPD